jgi:hypothetical protein
LEVCLAFHAVGSTWGKWDLHFHTSASYDYKNNGLTNGGIQEALKRLADAIDNLVGDVGEFDTENWREVVPKVTHHGGFAAFEAYDAKTFYYRSSKAEASGAYR